ncbi:cytochrome c oxidase subunit II [Cohnella sp. CFH 77786]|uniref:cupredoxin domain-containing protein n=1 Tax=Cohnella sp. CFH 77786 TaxID=2662265 RepID=UPI001C60850E|nr:cupredoxin domain-containing protein [Cohnella sp. CFH 77786]MBW5446952.1 cytochrome c oxidase subunit II [Cohnella sp. CFH 77786]
MRQKLAFLLVLGALAFGLAACGGKNDAGSSASPEQSQTASQEVVIKASNWEFDKPEYVVPKDTPVKITLELEGGHGIKVDGTDINLGPGNESTVVTLKAGTYEFKCSIMCGRGHKDMVSKLVVQ